jgi:2-C-methyl-D-erythritol 4-phosphate cytidylyltransferase
LNIAVILSAGSGSRFGANIPKQFINLAGKNIIEYTIATFEQNDKIDEICIVADQNYHTKLWDISKNNDFKKVKRIILGGLERKDSSYKAIQEYESLENINLIFHDAVRPFVSQEIINNTIKALETYDAVDVAIPTADTIIQIDTQTNTIEHIPQRSKLQRGQTPQAFKLKTIKKAHELSNQDMDEPLFTDDCGLVKQYLPATDIFVVNGEEKNIKITYPEDLLFAEKLIQLNSTSLSNNINFNNLKNKVIVVFGGSSGIGKNIVEIALKYNAKVDSYSRQNNIDIKNVDNIKKALQNSFDKYKRIDAIINCAAILTKDNLVDISDYNILEEVTTNFTSAIHIAKNAHPYLKQTQGSLILFTSSSYTRGRAGYSLYSSTKAAIVNFGEAISSEWQDDNIKVNVINPSRTATPMRIKHFGKEDKTTLLDSQTVAEVTLQTILQEFSGLVIDVKKLIK